MFSSAGQTSSQINRVKDDIFFPPSNVAFFFFFFANSIPTNYYYDYNTRGDKILFRKHLLRNGPTQRRLFDNDKLLLREKIGSFFGLSKRRVRTLISRYFRGFIFLSRTNSAAFPEEVTLEV